MGYHKGFGDSVSKGPRWLADPVACIKCYPTTIQLSGVCYLDRWKKLSDLCPMDCFIHLLGYYLTVTH
jgi:hypothetical protein